MPEPRRNFIAEYFNEHIRMPGFPAVIVTRGYLYEFLRDAGYNPKERGIGSVDYMVGAARQTDAALTDETERDNLLRVMKEAVRR